MTGQSYVAMSGLTPTHTGLTPEAVQIAALRDEEKRPGADSYDYLWLAERAGEWRLMRKPKSRRAVPAEKTNRKVLAVPVAPEARPCAECPETSPIGRAYCSARCRNAADRHDDQDGDI